MPTCRCFFWFLFSGVFLNSQVVWSTPLMAQAPKFDANPLLKKVVQIAEEKDVSSALALLESKADALEIAQNYSLLVKHLYMPGKDVPKMILFGRAGMDFAVREAKVSQAAGDAKTAESLMGLAKTMAYNIGSNTWPGWRDDGVVITATDIAIGLDAAKTNLRLGIELKRDDEILGNAHWLVGAQQLASGHNEAATASFQKSVAKFRSAKKTDYELMASVYVALAQLANSPADENNRKAFEDGITRLNERGNEDAKFFASQLKTAKSLFVKR